MARLIGLQREMEDDANLIEVYDCMSSDLRFDAQNLDEQTGARQRAEFCERMGLEAGEKLEEDRKKYVECQSRLEMLLLLERNEELHRQPRSLGEGR